MKNKLICAFILLLYTGLSAFAQDVRSSSGTGTGATAPSTGTTAPSTGTTTPFTGATAPFGTTAPSAGTTAPVIDVNRILMLARSSSDYRVTPGDVYTLTYAAGNTPVTYIISVDSSYRIRVSNLGVVNGAGKTFIQLKTEVETIVTNNYPLSGVQLALTQPSIFQVFVNGEVQRAGEVEAWGLSRLSSLIGNNLTEYASLRDISIRASSGQTRVYDLFKAQRLGDISHDPYLRPGDTITFNKSKRTVIIQGEVKRPGIYQLLDGENIDELIVFYGNGYTAIADSERIEVVRYTNSERISGDKIFLKENDLMNNYPLEDYDSVFIPQIIQLQPVMFVEGAVSGIGTDTSTEIISDASSSNRQIVRFNNGETYSSLIRRNEMWFTEVSDTKNAYIIRNNERIPIDLNIVLYDTLHSSNVTVIENDTLIVPFRQYFVSVSGAVVNPGRYPYIPDRDWQYYIGLAGGFVPERNAGNRIEIVDMHGKKLNKTDIITPETTITANTNHFLYFLGQYGPVITVISTVLTIISTILTIAAGSN